MLLRAHTLCCQILTHWSVKKELSKVSFGLRCSVADYQDPSVFPYAPNSRQNAVFLTIKNHTTQFLSSENRASCCLNTDCVFEHQSQTGQLGIYVGDKLCRDPPNTENSAWRLFRREKKKKISREKTFKNPWQKPKLKTLFNCASIVLLCFWHFFPFI